MDIVDRVNESKRLIFTVTTGRSGSAYLAALLRHSPGVAARHEPDPNFADVMREALTDPRVARDFWLERKLPAILREDEPVYAETSNVPCKGFLGPLLDLGIVPGLIVLRRPPRAVAASLLRVGCVPSRTDGGRRFLVGPDDEGVLPLEGWRELNDYQLCFWYCLEIERRAKVFSGMIRDRGERVVEVELDDLNSLWKVRRMMRGLNVGTPRGRGWLNLRRHLSRKVNARTRFRRNPLPESDEYPRLEREVLDRLGR